MVTEFLKMADDGVMNMTNQRMTLSVCWIGRGDVRDQEPILSEVIDEIFQLVLRRQAAVGIIRVFPCGGSTN